MSLNAPRAWDPQLDGGHPAVSPSTGWTCPGCGHSYAPWVPECHHCPEQPAFIAKGSDPGPIEVGR